MEIELDFQGFDATERTILDVQDWVHREQIKGLQVERKSDPPGKEEMGADPVMVLSAVLGSAALVELVKSLHVYLTVRRPKVTIKFSVGKGKKKREVEIEAENLPEQMEAVERVLALLESSGSD